MLELLPSELTVREVGAKLFLSKNTIKTTSAGSTTSWMYRPDGSRPAGVSPSCRPQSPEGDEAQTVMRVRAHAAPLS